MLEMVFLLWVWTALIIVVVAFFIGKKADEEWRKEARFYPVSPLKFIVLSFVTLGFYILYWFYKNWQIIKERDQNESWPFWRAVFSPIWFYPLINKINQSSDTKNLIPTSTAIFLTAAYFLLNVIVTRYAFFDDAPINVFRGIIYELGFFALILPLVFAVNKLNKPGNPVLLKNSRFGAMAILGILVGGPLALYSLGYAVNYIPVDRLYDQTYIWQKDLDYIEDIAFFEEDERLIYFYSTAVFSIKEDGNLLTTKKVVSYSEDLDGNPDIYFAYYDEIDEIEVDYPDNWIDYSSVTIWRKDGDWFLLYLPSEKDQAEKFISRIEEETGLVAKPAVFEE